MKLTTRAALIAAFLPTALFAESTLDANADGMISLDELQSVHPEIDSDTFMQADTDGDALLNEEELATATEAGLIPVQEG